MRAFPKGATVIAAVSLLAMGAITVATATTVPQKKALPLVSGTFKSPGYRLAAVGFNGKMTISKGQSFSFRAPQSQFTLQLLTTHGLYAGPVVVGGSKTKVVVGLQASVKLGTVSAVAGRGYGRISKRLPAADLVTSRWATAKGGVPIGNGRNLGLVVSKVTGGGAGPGQDLAHIGVPNELNIAVPGKHLLRALAPAQDVKALSAKMVLVPSAESAPASAHIDINTTCSEVPASALAGALGMAMTFVSGPAPSTGLLQAMNGPILIDGKTMSVTWVACEYQHTPGDVNGIGITISYLLASSDSEATTILQALCTSMKNGSSTNYASLSIGGGACVQGHAGGMQSSNGYLVDDDIVAGTFGSTSPAQTTAVLRSISPFVAAAAATAKTPAGGGGSPGGSSGNTGTTPASTVGVSPWMSQLFLPMSNTVNEDAVGVTPAEIDAALVTNLDLKLVDIPSGDVVELDCNGLSYCSAGGTGEAVLENLPTAGAINTTEPFPAAMTDPATGFGVIVGPQAPSTLLGGGPEFNLEPVATSTQIGSGDVITEVVTDNGTTTETPTTVDFVFETVPAIASYSDTGGDSATISYPVGTGLGSMNDPLKVAAGPDGDVVITFTVYRPQRAGIPGAGEPAYMDIGNLAYALDAQSNPSASGPTGVGGCPASSYSGLSPTLSIGDSTAGLDAGRLVDAAADAPARPSDTISFTVDLTKCLASKGWAAVPVGQPIGLDISANSQSSPDHTNQTFSVERTN